MRFGVVQILSALLLLASPVLAQTETPSAPDWGVNFWAHDYYTGDAAFVDATRAFSYDMPEELAEKISRDPAAWDDLPLTDQGVPLDPEIRLRSFLKGYPDGTYKLRYEGTGEVRFEGGARLLPDSLDVQGDLTYGLVAVDRTEEDLIRMSFHEVNESDPVRDVRLICPGYAVDASTVVREEFIERVQPFSTFRFMDWNATNSSNAEKWEKRRPADYLVQTPGWRPRLPMGGMAYELMVAVCNAAQKDMWVCVPHLADNEYVHELAELLRSRLHRNLTCIVELSNELWNFSQGPELGRKMINPDWSWQGSNVTLYYGAVAPRLAQVSRIFRDVWGAEEMDRLEIVLAGQSANPWHIAKALEFYTDRRIAPRRVIDAIAIAPYIPVDGKHSELDPLMKDMQENVQQALSLARKGTPADQARGQSKLYYGIRRHKDLADQYGLKLYAYEGGQHVWHNRVTDGDLVGEAQHHPAMRQIYRDYFRLWETVNPGGLFAHYTFTSGSWGLLADLRDPGSPKWDGLMSVLLPGGDATLDGEVNFADFEILRNHFQREGTWWWQQGDFDGDRAVDVADFNTLRQNIKPENTREEEELQNWARQRCLAE